MFSMRCWILQLWIPLPGAQCILVETLLSMQPSRLALTSACPYWPFHYTSGSKVHRLMPGLSYVFSLLCYSSWYLLWFFLPPLRLVKGIQCEKNIRCNWLTISMLYHFSAQAVFYFKVHLCRRAKWFCNSFFHNEQLILKKREYIILLL